MSNKDEHEEAHEQDHAANNSEKSQPQADALAPCQSEEDSVSEDDALISDEHILTVGIGASAGGLQALYELFEHLPDNTQMAFIVTQHIGSDSKSMLSELLARKTSMPVAEIIDNTQLEANHVYVAPPGKQIGLLHGRLQLLPIVAEHAPFLVIDYFMRSLAQDQRSNAIGIILSGTGSDGTLGLTAIKAEGGITFAQDTVSALYAGMPNSAANAGCVDMVLPPDKIAAGLADISQHRFAQRELTDELPTNESSLQKIFFLLRHHTGHDFSHYKSNTIKRRINRRMLLNRIYKIDQYVHHLQRNRDEVEGLFDDILINVTNFFRDPQAFEALKSEVLTNIIKDRSFKDAIRIWVPGCATGEEPYSIAMTLIETLGDRWMHRPIQIFATDIDKKAIERARVGIYPESIIADLTPARLQNFFTKVAGGYQVSKSIREMCVFAEQDVVTDPPFSRLDLICCRNLLIYFDNRLQKKAFSIFHFALKNSGMLFLGSSESISNGSGLFLPMDKTYKIYAKKVSHVRPAYDFASVSQSQALMPPLVSPDQAKPLRNIQREAEQHILNQFCPPSFIIDQKMEIVGFLGQTGIIIEPAPGASSLQLFKLVAHDLAIELRNALTVALRENTSVFREAIPFKQGDEYSLFNLSIKPLQSADVAERYFLIIFEKNKSTPAKSSIKPKQHALGNNSNKDEVGNETQVNEGINLPHPREIQLEYELGATRQELQAIIREQIGTNEELQTANEEIQSANEELQSTNEELESAKEELQSTNEELVTVNDELEIRNQELEGVNNDLSNLLNSVNLPMLMLSMDARIRHFTPMAKPLFNIIDSDIGRPLSNIRPNIQIADFDRHIHEVIDTVTPKSLEVKDNEGHWYSLTIRPYKTADHRIAGAVIIMFDITDIKLDPAQERRLAAVVRDSFDAVILQAPDGKILAWNRGAEKMYGFSESEALEMNYSSLVPEDKRAEMTHYLQSTVAGDGQPYFEIQHLTKDNRPLMMSLTATALKDPTGHTYALATTERDVTHLLREYSTSSRTSNNSLNCVNEIVIQHDLDGKITYWNSKAQAVYGYSEVEALQMPIVTLIPAGEVTEYKKVMSDLINGVNYPPFKSRRLTKSGHSKTLWLTLALLIDQGIPYGIIALEQECEG